MQEAQLTKILGRNIYRTLKEQKIAFQTLQEIRIRIGKPLVVMQNNHEIIIAKNVTKEEFRETLEYISNYSLYAFENELKQGFITVEGGHRVGVAGQVLIENGKVKNMKQIASMNIRISHEILDCSTMLMPYISSNKHICHTLLISPPCCGKTTMLRDIIRQISDGNSWVEGKTVGVVDERSELGACYQGIPQNHLGVRTDILDCCPKAEGMLMLIRSMAPRIIAVDEIGSEEDIRALEYAMHCGCKMIATVHGASMEEIRTKPLFDRLVKERRFERYVVMSNRKHIGTIEGIYDERGSMLYKEVIGH